MKKLTILFTIILLITIVSCKKDKKEVTSEAESIENSSTTEVGGSNKKIVEEVKDPVNMETQKVIVKIKPNNGSNVTGSAVFNQEKGVVSMIALFAGLSEGTYAIHLHEKADCSTDDVKSTRKLGDNKSPKGHIENFTSNEKGHATLTFTTKEWCIDCGDPNKDILEKSFTIRKGSFDLKSQELGTLLSCTEINK